MRPLHAPQIRRIPPSPNTNMLRPLRVPFVDGEARVALRVRDGDVGAGVAGAGWDGEGGGAGRHFRLLVWVLGRCCSWVGVVKVC